MIDLIASGMSGGLLGLLGSFGANILGYFKTKQEFKQQVELKKLDHAAAEQSNRHALEQIRAEAEYRQAELQINAERDVDVAANAALVASYAGIKPYAGDSKLLQFAEFFKQMTRPVLTFLLVFMTAFIYSGGDVVIQTMIAQAVVSITAAAIAWWFGDRQIAKHVSKKVLG